MPRLALATLCMLSLISAAGCQPPISSPRQITTGYGRKAGANYVNSVNGTAVFARMIEASGSKVSRAEAISPRIKNVERIVWFRDSYEAPTEEVLNALEDWLREGFDRQIVIVGRDYDAAIDYWRGVVEQAAPKDLVEARRRLAKAKASFQRQRNVPDSELLDCRWYDQQRGDFTFAKKATGPWSESIEVEDADLKLGSAFKYVQPPSSMNWNMRYNDEVLLELDGRPMITRLTKSEYDGGEILLVSNACFLTNYGLVNHENRELAQRLIDSKSFDATTLFLETGEDGARVLKSESGHETWAWIAKPPLRYIVPHFLMIGIFLCFVMFPIFGRAKHLNPDENKFTFREHLRAMGKLLSRTRDGEFARNKIDRYLQRNQKDSEK